MTHRLSLTVLPALLLFCLLQGGVAAAEEAPSPTPHDIVAQQTALRAQVLGAGGAFGRMDRRTRERLAARQQAVIDMLDGVTSIDALAVPQRTELFNALEWIRATIERQENSRRICEYTPTVGSHRQASVCTTAREEREHRDNAREQVRRAQGCNVSRLACVGD